MCKIITLHVYILHPHRSLLAPYTCTGKGSNKKNAKRAAAEEMLRTMGYNTVPTPTNPNAAPNKSALKNLGQVNIFGQF